MNAPSSTEAKPAVPQGRLAAAAGPLLSLLVVLHRARDLDLLRDLRATVDRLFQEFRNRARDEGVGGEDIDDACYALAAAFDETLLNARWAGRDEWQRNSLAKRFCNDEFVGMGFYDKLAQVRRASVPRADVIEVFYYCLVSGFQGKLVENPKELGDLLDELSREIGSPVKTLSPAGVPEPAGGRLQPIRRFPWLALVVSFGLLPFLVGLLCANALDHQADAIARVLGVK